MAAAFKGKTSLYVSVRVYSWPDLIVPCPSFTVVPGGGVLKVLALSEELGFKEDKNSPLVWLHSVLGALRW